MNRFRELAGGRPALAAWLGYTLLAAVGRVSSYGAPANRDMGQYMYIGGEVLNGATPYAGVANNKGPANFVLWAFLRAVCGDSPVAVRIVWVLATGLAALAVGAFVTHHAGRSAGLLAGATLALLASAFQLEAFSPNNAQFGLVAMAGAWALATGSDRASAVAAGGLTGLSALLNPALGVVAPFVAWELWRGHATGAERARSLGLAAAGAIAALAPFAVWLGAAGAIDDMRIQVFGQVQRALATDRLDGGPPGTPPRALQPEAPLDVLINLPDSLLWIAGLVGCGVALRDPRLRPAAIASALWIVAAIVRVEVASYGFNNQYVPGLAGIAAGMALGTAAVWPSGSKPRFATAALVLAAPAWSAVIAPQLLQLGIPIEQRGNSYTRPVVDFVREHTAPGSTLTVVGYDPQVQWLADRRAPTRFFDSFGLSQRDDYVAERRRDLFARPPDAIAAAGDAAPDPDLEELIATGGYELAYDRVARVWLRAD